jgi:tRNA pseudouridine38-40 synthase
MTNERMTNEAIIGHFLHWSLVISFPMRTLRLTIAYDGAEFGGWQRQQGRRTVQGELERVLKQITGEEIVATSSGRTDSGVHALAQVVGFKTATWLADDVLLRALNAELPDDLAALDLRPAPEDFDPIRDAVRKRYRYVIKDGRVPDLFSRRYLWHIHQRLDVDAMQQAARGLLGRHDFTSYETTGSRRVSPIRTVYDILVERRQAEFTDHVIVEVEADGFLYNMVRNIVGTLVRVGRGQQEIAWPAEVLAARDRTRAGMTAPAQGLFMLWVKYGEDS